MHGFLIFLGTMVFVFLIIYFFVDSDLFISDLNEFIEVGLILTGAYLLGMLVKYLLEKNK